MCIRDSQWAIWVLSDGDIDGIAEEMKIDPEKLSKDDRESIARHFKKMVEACLGDSPYSWVEMLKECIKGVTKGR